ncbi:bifunctional DNA-binding transcriptional regulator/O6-methylguanine-DNA methyltransferase Ada [Oscillatoria sp. FACHB-1406]|uniref:bifunctional DNA-binding transcriptional regulator/O6-methylguanine-DNA methyltransferase Ada n=1 Tax=Oscillatoria sp. FACHB-1406 TaxID=2692846 RepID=UPI001687214F|nr:bifunctional DNA-binding transcriptional regulator/O6-methylguanine-DNA methyltransferase Ada [Oscillatoria sp. FACHB-1406]MBD2580404.1 bifunctional DNA-binding transcriptional regulator/O6-methylguanine-DNA methyltransferase Ada [Oscillatoria sp. FACHB-1406]
MLESDFRWQAIVKRDRAFDERFVYSVKTTRIYCRPSCPARQPKRQNVQFYSTAAAAERAGFRACQRCTPNQPSLYERQTACIARVCREIASRETIPNLEELARSVGWSPSHLHRTFKAIAGVTPRDYAIAHRTQRLQTQLPSNSTVTAAIYEAGFNASSRFYETYPEILGMTPTQYRTGGEHLQIYFAIGECSLGSILVAQTEKGICAIFLGDAPEPLLHNLEQRFPRAELIGGDAKFECHIARVIGFVEAPALGLDLPLDARGTAFQQRVWQALQEIPFGTTATYAEIARKIGSPQAVRAVASACAANPIAVAIPCHRVVRSDGSLSGYRWGVERKQALQEWEAMKSILV